MSVREMIRRELEKKLREYRNKASRLAKDLRHVKRAEYLAFYVFIGTGWEAGVPKLHFKACGELKDVMRAAMEEFKRKNGKASALGEYVCFVTALMPSGNPVFVPHELFMPYIKKYGKNKYGKSS